MTHNEGCDCELCRWANSTTTIPAAPDFDHEWREAPRGMTNYVERSVAEYFYLRGVRAGELNQMIEENRVFREMAERRGF